MAIRKIALGLILYFTILHFFPTFAISKEATKDRLLSKEATYIAKHIKAVDGDSLRIDNVLVRISNLDTPEKGGRADCDAERFLGAIATRHAEELVKKKVDIFPLGKSDKFRRPLVRVLIEGKDCCLLYTSPSPRDRG